jgi:hypothetical protein
MLFRALLVALAFSASAYAQSAEPPNATVHVEGPRAAVLEGRASSEDAWSVVCQTPCDVRLPLAFEYRIVGKGIHTSDPFTLQAHPDQIETITVRPGWKAGSFAGALVVVVSGLVLTVGLGIGLVELAVKLGNVPGCDGPCPSANSTATTTSLVLMLTGLVGVGGGLALLATNDETSTRQRFPSLVPPAPAQREQTWERALPRRATMPVLSFRF